MNEELDLSKLSVVTEQGVFGGLNIKNPTEKKISKKDKKEGVQDDK